MVYGTYICVCLYLYEYMRIREDFPVEPKEIGLHRRSTRNPLMIRECREVGTNLWGAEERMPQGRGSNPAGTEV